MDENTAQPCAGKGISCPEFLERDYLKDMVLALFQIPLVTFVLYLSVFKLADEVLKWYTVFVSIFLLPFTTTLALAQSIEICSLYWSGLQHIIARYSILTVTSVLTRMMTLMQFRILSLFVAVAYLLSYKKPTFFQSFISPFQKVVSVFFSTLKQIMAQLSAVQQNLDMAQTAMVIMIYLRVSRRSKTMMICMTIASVCLRLLFIINECCFCFVTDCATKINAVLLVRIDRWINAISTIACALATIVVVVVTFFVMLLFWYRQRKNSALGTDSFHRKSVLQMAQFMLYFVPLTLSQFIFFGSALLFVLLIIFPQLEDEIPTSVQHTLFEFSVRCDQFFELFMPICTLVVLTPYRKAVIRLLRCTTTRR